MDRKSVLASLLSVSLLNGAMGPAALAAAVPENPASSSYESELIQSLSAALQGALEQAGGSDTLTLAAQGLELDSVDLEASKARAAASRALLRSIENPGVVEGLRAFLRSRASHPEAGRALALLRQWEGILSDKASRASLQAGLSGAGDLDSSMGGTQNSQAGSQASIAGKPAVLQPGLSPAGSLLAEGLVTLDGPIVPSSSHWDAHSGLSPPTRAPPHFSQQSVPHLTRTLQKDQETQKSRKQGTLFAATDLSGWNAVRSDINHKEAI